MSLPAKISQGNVVESAAAARRLMWKLIKPSDGSESSVFQQENIKSNDFLQGIEESAEDSTATQKRRYNNETMSMTREELQAHLDKQSAQTQAALAVQNGAIDARLGKFEERIDQAISSMQTSRAEFRQDLNQFKIDVKADLSQYEKDLKADNKTTRLTMIVTAIGTVIAIASFNATVLSNMVASFESGKNTMQSINDTTKRLEALQARMEAQAEQPFASASQPRK